MKALKNIKKLAAIGAGGALVASAIAPIVAAQAFSLQKSDIFQDSGSPAVKIVVGSQAALSDAVWAGNMAAAIAEQARTYNAVDVSGEAAGGDGTATVEDISVKLIVGGSITYSNAKTLVTGESSGTFDLNSGSDVNEVANLDLTDSTFSNLKNITTTIKWNGSTLSRTFKEKIGLKKLDIYVDNQNNGNVSDLELQIGTGDLNYTLDLGGGIPVYETTTSGTNFTDGTNDNIIIPFFGENYLVKEVNKSTNFVRLIKSQDTQTFNEGDIIPDLPGKNALAGETVSVKINSLANLGGTSNFQANVSLLNEAGDIVSTKTVQTGENIDDALTVDGETAIATVLYVDSIFQDPSSGVGSVNVLVGSNIIDLDADLGYPYDSSVTSSFPYEVDFTYGGTTDGNFVTTISIKNGTERWRDGGSTHPPLYPSESGQALTTAGETGVHEAAFLGNLAEGALGKDLFKIEFKGLETNESVNTIKFYNHTLEYNDVSDRHHVLPLSIQLAKDQTGGSSFQFDNRTLYFASDTTDRYIDLNTSGTLNGVKVLRSNAYHQNAPDGLRNVLFPFGSAIDVNVLVNGVVDINGSYFVLTDGNAGVNDSNGTVMLRADGNVTFSTAAISSSTATDYLESWVDANGVTHYDLLWNNVETTNYVAYNGNPVTLKGQDDVTYNYALFADSSDTGDLYLLLDSSSVLNGRFDADLNFHGTNLVEDANYISSQPADGNASVGLSVVAGTAGANRPYYWPNQSDFGGGVSNLYYIARFGVETAGDVASAAEATADFDTLVYIDTSVSGGYAPALPNTNLTYPGYDLNYNSTRKASDYPATAVSDGSQSFNMDSDPTTTTLQNKMYNDYGTYFEIGTDRTVTIKVPDNRRRPVIIVKMEGSTSEVTGGETIEIVEGDTGTTETGTQITVDEVTYTASCGGGSGEPGTCAADPENYFSPAPVPEQMVFLDTDNPSGKLVLVGGHLVNRLSADVANIRDVLTAPGDGAEPWVDEETGYVVVAGYTPADTVASARAFIRAVEAIDMMG